MTAPTSGAGTGELVAERTYRVDPEAIVRYAGASGDFTSFHYDTARARSMGYNTLFAMGMLAAGQLGTLAAQVAGTPIRSISFRFQSRSWAGHDVTCQVRHETADGSDPDVLVLRAVDDTGAEVVTGRAELRPQEAARTSG